MRHSAPCWLERRLTGPAGPVPARSACRPSPSSGSSTCAPCTACPRQLSVQTSSRPGVWRCGAAENLTAVATGRPTAGPAQPHQHTVHRSCSADIVKHSFTWVVPTKYRFGYRTEARISYGWPALGMMLLPPLHPADGLVGTDCNHPRLYSASERNPNSRFSIFDDLAMQI